MRIVIDMQGAQTESRFRGIGRYTLALTQAIVRNRGEHQVILALSGLFPETIAPIRAAFDGQLDQENIRVWHAPTQVRSMDSNNTRRREEAERIREAFLSSLKPDVIHISSLFEGYVDDAVTSIKQFDTDTLTSVSLYDLIPLLNPGHYLHPNPAYEKYYLNKLAYLKKADILLAISEFSRQEGQEHLKGHEDRIINVSTAIDPHFQPLSLENDQIAQLRQKFGLHRPFVLYTGGSDERKNLPRLIQAFAALPPHLRNTYHLLLAGKICQGDKTALHSLAKAEKMEPDTLQFTGYISDDELVQLYNLCELFVFPSWHEGFGLPALEAMACGAPVIGANTTSLPEVIGLQAAQFDPLDVTSITEKLTQALEDQEFRATLRAHGLQQAQNFSWDETARRTLKAFESLTTRPPCRKDSPARTTPANKPRLAFVSPLPPERTGIADYSAELLPALAEHYNIEIIAAQDQVDTPWVNAHSTVRDVQWLREHAEEIDRVLYQIGNSPYHRHMLALMQEVPGTVILHDFYMSGLLAWLELQAGSGNIWTESLYAAHGYSALRERYQDIEAAKNRYPANLHILQHANGIVVHSEHARKLASEWYGEDLASEWQVVPLLRSPATGLDKAAARQALGISPDTFLVCSFGFLAPTKLNHRLLEAWLNSALAAAPQCRLVFVGENHGGQYGAELKKTIRESGLAECIEITGFATPELFRNYLTAADIAVQLRTHSRGETSAAVLDGMNHGLPLIVNANGAMTELDAQAVWMLTDEFDDNALTTALETLWRDPERRRTLGEHAQRIIHDRHTPAACAKHYAEAIERFHRNSATSTPALLKAITALDSPIPDDNELIQLANALARTFPQAKPAKRLFLDITATCHSDLKTGIERVARALLLALLDTPPAGYRTEPIYLSNASGAWKYHHAHTYTLGLLNCPTDALGADEIVEPENGDLLLGLDLSGNRLIEADKSGLLASYRNQGVKVHFMVHDILPIRMPEVFPPGAEYAHTHWLQTIAKYDGIVGVSQTVADDVAAWLQETAEQRPAQQPPIRINWSHHGADVSNSAPSQGLPESAPQTLQQLAARPSFLMVGTIEPRKGYLQTLDAFTQLWEQGHDINLIIVGNEGWTGLPANMRRDIPETVNRLHTHPQSGQRLHWLAGISDEYLEKIYAGSTCLIAASYGEGFGLPLIEAAQHHLPIMARDIPVFREVAGEHASYFRANQADELAKAIRTWLDHNRQGQTPASKTLPWLTWQGSAQRLTRALLGAPSDENTN